MFDFLKRGPLMDEAGFDGGGGVAVAEPSADFGGDSGGSVTSTDTSTDAEVHDAEFVDQGTQEGENQQQTQALVKAGERAVEKGKFTQTGRAAVEALKALSPTLAKEYQSAMLQRDWFRREFPGGVKEVNALRALAQQNGGETGLSELRNTANLFNELDELFSASDPRFLDQITTTPQEQKALVGLMGASFAKFEKLSPEHFAHHTAKAFTHLLDTARVPVIAARMVDLLNRAHQYKQGGNNEMAASFIQEIAASYNELSDILGKVYTAAGKPPAQEVANPQVSDRERQLSERETSLRNQEWNTAVTGERRRVFSGAWANLTKGRNLTADQEANVKGFYELRMTAKTRAWQNNAERFRANGDKDGFLREQYAFFQRAIPEALRHAIAQALPAKPGPKANGSSQTQQFKPNISRGTNGQGTAKGAVRVARMPSASDLDAVRTTSEMLRNNQAVRRDGTVVQWA